MAQPTRVAERFAEDLAQALGPALRSVLLYGSVARGEAVPAVSDINVLVLVERVRVTDLPPLAPLARRWAEQGNTAPLLLGWDDWARAGDAFAVELSDMLEHGRVLRGEDPLAGAAVERRALRLQTERELRGKMIQLHEGLLLAGDPTAVGALLLTALPSFATYFRATLRLAGRPVPERTDGVVERVAELVGGEAGPVIEAWRARGTGRAPTLALDDPRVHGYYELVQRTTHFVDRLPEEAE